MVLAIEGGMRLGRALRERYLFRLLLGAVASLAVTGPSCGQLTETELHCEEALAHLHECCPGFRPNEFACVKEEAEGCGCGREADLDLAISKQVLDLECDDLAAGNWCALQPKPELCSGGNL